MREILFRGKRIDNGEWVEGWLIKDEYGFCIASDNSLYHVDGCEWNFDDVLVDPATVGQFTGLTDKNGKKIFEGDVVDRATERSGQKSSHRTGVVVFKRYGFVFEPIGNRGHGMWICGELEVIGNIHDKEET